MHTNFFKHEFILRDVLNNVKVSRCLKLSIAYIYRKKTKIKCLKISLEEVVLRNTKAFRTKWKQRLKLSHYKQERHEQKISNVFSLNRNCGIDATFSNIKIHFVSQRSFQTFERNTDEYFKLINFTTIT